MTNLNFLLPLLVGGPDMAKKGSLAFSCGAVFNQGTHWACVSRRFYILIFFYKKNAQAVMKDYFEFFIKKSFSNFTDKLRLNVYFSSCVFTGFNNNRNNLGPYIAGLFEGDGHIWIQKQKGTKRHNPRFCITFGLKNEPLCNKLLDIIGSGFIRYKHSENACVLVVSPVVGLKKIVNLINGELRTPKIHQLHSLINWLNINHNAQLEKLPLNKDSLDNNSWLSGFVDADGSFSVQYTKTEDGAKKRKISCRMRIEQRVLDPITNDSYSDILNQICTFLNCNLLTRTQKRFDRYYIVYASSDKSNRILIDYLHKYPLFSSKFLDYKDWERVVNSFPIGYDLDAENWKTINDLKAGMNMNRTHFNWDHLINFYTIPVTFNRSRHNYLSSRAPQLINLQMLTTRTRSFSSTAFVFNNLNGSPDYLLVKLYENVDKDKLLIVRDNKAKAGVYRFLNLVNGKSYVGSSSNLARRFRDYLNINYLESELKKGRSNICTALLKHGYSSFQLEILEYCTSDKAIEREQYFLDTLKPEYNILTTAGSSLGRPLTDEAKAKMSLAWTEERKKQHLVFLNRLNASPEQQEWLKEFKFNRKGCVKPEGSGRSNFKVEVFDTLTQENFIYSSISDAGRAMGYTKEGLSLAFKRQKEKGNDFILVKKKRYMLKKID